MQPLDPAVLGDFLKKGSRMGKHGQKMGKNQNASDEALNPANDSQFQWRFRKNGSHVKKVTDMVKNNG